MFDKCTLIFEQIKTAGMLYEVRHGGPNKLIHAMQRFSNAADPTTPNWQRIEDVESDAATMALEFLEMIYNGAPVPEWLSAAEEYEGTGR